MKLNLRVQQELPRLLTGAVLLCQGVAASALGPVDVPPTYGGEILLRPRLSGDWFELRDKMAKKGIVWEADMFLLPQGVASGGTGTGAAFWGNIDYSLNLDTKKMGLWPGGFFKFEAITSFGHTIDDNAGTIISANVSSLFPEILQPATGLMEASYTQFLSTHFGVTMGKMNLFDFTTTEFYGDYHTQFLNSGLNFNMALAMVPISAYGGGIVILPTKDITLMSIALDPSGTPMNNDITEAFKDGVMLLNAASVTIKPFGLVGHQSLTGTWSNKTRFSLDQNPSNIGNMLLQERFPRLANPGRFLYQLLAKYYPELLEPTEPANTKDNTWSVVYSFDQYLWQPKGDSKSGIGIFFSFGATDGNPNPIQYTYTLGVGGKGVIPKRPDDSFGIAWARSQFSDQFVPLLRDTFDLGLNHEDAIEFYYTVAVTPWFKVSPNLQIIKSGLNKALIDDELVSIDTSVIPSIRMSILF